MEDNNKYSRKRRYFWSGIPGKMAKAKLYFILALLLLAVIAADYIVRS